MRSSSHWLALCSLSLLTPLVLSGCAPERNKLSSMLLLGNQANLAPKETEQREKFMTERDPDAFRWLLTHRIHNEMTVDEASSVFGEAGERRFDDAEYKKNGGYYQTTDVGYQWGPDRNGHTVVLYFREGKLINFDPAEFR